MTEFEEDVLSGGDSDVFLEGKEQFAEYNEESTEPEDRYNIVWSICLLFGIALLFPFNAYITASDYWFLIFPCFANLFIFVLVLAYNYPAIAALYFNIVHGNKFSLTGRFVVCLGVDIVVLTVIPVVSSFELGIAPLIVSLIGIFLSGFFTSMLFGTVLGFVSMFPPSYTTAVMSGNGVAGVIVGLLRIITRLIFGSDEAGLRISSDVYFGCAVLTMVITLVAYFWMLRLPYVKYRMSRQRLVETTESPETLTFSEVPTPPKGRAKNTATAPLYQGKNNGNPQWMSDYQKERVSSSDGELTSLTSSEMPEEEHVTWQMVLPKIWREALLVFTTFLTTLAIFPGYVILVNPCADCIYPIAIVFVFQVFDFVGRTIPRFTIFTPRDWMWLPIVGRIIFIALFTICIQPKWLDSDWWAYGFMVIFALSNGYLGTLCMVYAPSRVDTDKEKETAGAIMSFFLNFGIFFAAHVSLLFYYAVEGSDGFQLYC
eukprot:CAMPEP_0119124454 /NCGR_PEP_ID=MMETSP1310-20130426/4076_1 /TAXON_ID=464262 /ORGANISM="Genus nov. species nov., Strain RCC2339" /LENGTH=485 /DNA_ID=CAMNT_0007114409 /DNA_START=89 /DNA_END=1543 /DNA_ORIENTATION=+